MDSTKQTWARGGLFFAASLMLIMGIYQIFVGIAAIMQNSFFVVAPNYVYEIDTTAWGWIHLVIGVVAVITGFFLFSGTTWARTLGIALAIISAVANFFFLPYYPLWSLLIIALDIFAIWAIAAARFPSGLAGESYAADAGAFSGEVPQASERWPAENVPAAAAGRHWAPENVKEGAGAAPPMTAEERERAAAAARAASEGRRPPGPPQTPPSTTGR